ncbi:MAG: type I restriction endonuclease subunit R [Bacteroidetes bacterium]|nr:type I restriction endonuclease subunit R [Bacteroidota bacterium]MBU1423022.1 type I restriction endonuclease subunit R [Bacteroidota bacterium]MBU2636840.1 type I restriction endonuclease subunit R [Bacteroidota bacterium]
MTSYSEDVLIEQPAINCFSNLNWFPTNCFYESFGSNGSLGRETPSEAVLVSHLRPALQKLNPELSPEAIELAIEELTKDRSSLSPTNANREIYKLLKDGVPVTIRNRRGEEVQELVRVIDLEHTEKNDFFLASQFWITGDMYKRRADLIGFVNGLPLVFIELKAIHKRLENAYYGNLTDYKDTIPQIFWYNGFIILSNGSESKIGTISSQWEHFADWKKINSEGEEGVISLETMIRGTCEPKRLLDILENFILYSDEKGGLVKMVAKNHQYLGVNSVFEAVRDIKDNRGRLGVFWHTQGSGKSYSMVFFSQKVLRKLPGNYTFLIVTDRNELDGQIYKNFANAGVVTEAEERVRADSGEHLKQLLKEDHRYLFTLIQKFHTDPGKKYPELSNRSDIIVITDEAHRSQYDILALNMRNALPNAAFIGFTGTPLMAGEERTRQVFGDYVSIYNFKQSIDDKATVPLYYENHIPELQLTNQDLNEDIQNVIEEAMLNEEQEKKLEREFSREYHLITRDDRLEKIAEDIVAHFMGRGYAGKAMVVLIDKATAVRMYDKVQKYWKKHLEDLKINHAIAVDDKQKEDLQLKIRFMEETDMAVVVSQAQNEIQEFRDKGLDIAKHRRRMVTEEMDVKFKDPKDPFRIVFLCAMWMTGFDVPSCSTIYLDKPMRNHTLMQTIARANRVFKDKLNGLIVDYVGVFRNLQKALAIYGSASGGGIMPGDSPVQDKQKLVEELREAIEQLKDYCEEREIDLDKIISSDAFPKIKLIVDAVDAILENDESKKKYLSLALSVQALYKAMLPDPKATEFVQIVLLTRVIAEKIRSLSPPVDISYVMTAVEQVLDGSIAAEGYVIHEQEQYGKNIIDLSMIDFEALKAKFEKSRKHIEVERLKGAINARLLMMVRLNKNRMNYLEQFQKMIDEYNAGSANVEQFFSQLVEFAKTLNEEERRGVAEGLNEEELTMFDILTKPDMKITKSEEKEIKKVAKELLDSLKREKLVLDWRKKQQSRANVRICIENILDKLPSIYTRDIYLQKCDFVYQHVYDSYYGEGRSVYVNRV